MAETVKSPEILFLSTHLEGLTLRQLATPEDDMTYFEAQNDNLEHLAKFNNKIYETLDDVKEARLNAGSKIDMGIWRGDDFEGMVFAKPDEDGREAEIGYWLREDATGHGYATAAVKSLVEFIAPKFERVFAEANLDNHRSLGVLERAGFVKTDKIEDREWGQMAVFDFKTGSSSL